MADRYIEINRWEEFQHYANRDPVWIKNYTRLLDQEEYRALSWTQKGVLHALWLAYARTRRQCPDSTVWLSRYFGERVTRATLDRLNDAGFIRFVASTTLAARYQDASPEEEEEEETTPSFLPELQDADGRTEGRNGTSDLERVDPLEVLRRQDVAF